MRRYDEFQRYNVFCRPDWRMERVLQLVDQLPVPGRCSRRDDLYIREARKFLLRWRRSDDPAQREELFFACPGLYYAYQIHERSLQEPEPALFMQARLLARQSWQEIAHCLGTLPETVEWYSRLFFDVTERLVHRDWVMKQVLLPALMRSLTDMAASPAGSMARPFLDGTLKLFAYFGGPLVAEVMIHGFLAEPPPQRPEDLPGWFDRHWAATLRRRSLQAAQVFDVNRYNVVSLFQLHREIVDSERALRGDDKNKQDELYNALQALLESAPVCSGYTARQWHKDTPLGRMDEQAAELRDEELFVVQAGQSVRLELPEGGLPPPRKTTAHGPAGEDM